MPRPHRPRRICGRFQTDVYKPASVPLQDLEEIELTQDELEALRLADLEGRYQQDVAASMDVSRQTAGRILESAHRKVADVLVNGKALRIGGGPVAEADDEGVDQPGFGWGRHHGMGRHQRNRR